MKYSTSHVNLIMNKLYFRQFDCPFGLSKVTWSLLNLKIILQYINIYMPDYSLTLGGSVMVAEVDYAWLSCNSGWFCEGC